MRFEIGLKKEVELVEIKKLIDRYNLIKVNLIDKPNQVDNLWVARKLLAHKKDLDITLHFSINNRYEGNPLFTFQSLQEFIYLAAQEGINKYLVVSGNPKRQLETIKAFEFYATDIFKRQDIYTNYKHQDMFFCAYNPSLKNGDLVSENQRLREKIQTKVVTGVYLQISSELENLERGVSFIKSIDTKIVIMGSVLIPSISILQSMRFRPWHGVSLSEDYFSDILIAQKYTQSILNFYKLNNIETVLTINPFNQDNLDYFNKTYSI